MKKIILLIFLLQSAIGFAQETSLKRGNSVYIEAPKSDIGKSAAGELQTALRDWDYWKVASSKKDADFILKLDTKISGGVTWTSWGGKSVALSASMRDKNDGEIWQSEYYKASPNGSNGFDSQSAAVKKLVRGLKKKFN
ncbi:hypothetical protein [Dyadobacter bucti]|uniref:hypothetical protein n=1 Tax=Dyadobacter bucti TaxID=2572203 RepID=UPI003F721412